jgi:hypothetical protein
MSKRPSGCQVFKQKQNDMVATKWSLIVQHQMTWWPSNLQVKKNDLVATKWSRNDLVAAKSPSIKNEKKIGGHQGFKIT